jgi:hypothetical protein
LDVVADVIASQKLDAARETDVKRQAVDIPDDSDTEAGDRHVEGIAGSAGGLAVPGFQLLGVCQDSVLEPVAYDTAIFEGYFP